MVQNTNGWVSENAGIVQQASGFHMCEQYLKLEVDTSVDDKQFLHDVATLAFWRTL